MNAFSFNTAVARLMELVNALNKYDALPDASGAILSKVTDTLILLLAPCAPHFAEELWSMRGYRKSVFLTDYPVADENALIKDEVELAVQLNSKVKSKIFVPAEATEEEVKAIALADEAIARQLTDKQVVKVIFVKGRLINLIVR